MSIIVVLILVIIIRENVKGILLYIPSLPNNRTMKLFIIYSTLPISLCNIFIDKEKYHEI